MRGLLRSLAPLLLLLLLGSASADQVKGVSVWKFRPTQQERGYDAAIRFHVEHWQDEARKRGMSLRQYADEVLRPYYAARPLPAVIDPTGAIRNTDGHHRITALRRVSRMTGVKFDVTADVLADYRGWKEADYAHHFLEVLGKGQFTVADERLPAVERIRRLPQTYGAMKDNPLRSTLEVVMNRFGLEGSTMRDYVEFRLARRLVADGLLDELAAAGVVPRGTRTLPRRLALEPRVVDVIAARLARPDVKRFLLDEAKDEASRAIIAGKLAAAN